MLAQISMSAPLDHGKLIHHSPYLLDSKVTIEPKLILLHLEERGGGLTDMQTFPLIRSQVIYGRFKQQTGHQNLTETANML